ncbi:MAG: AAA family ATPase [Clostridiales bacterium]|nr:AAA family ATPase [Clostridiales bacterium]
MDISEVINYSESDNFNAKEIDEEAEHLASVQDMIREQIALLEDDGFAYRIVDFYDENEVEEYRAEKHGHDARQRDIKILKSAISSPYFSRMKLRQVGATKRTDTPSMTKTRTLRDCSDEDLGEEVDIYVGANVIFYRGKIIVYSHNSPLGNQVYSRFEDGKIYYGGYTYEVIFRRKFDIRDGKLIAVFQDYSIEQGGVVYDKFLAHMLKVKRGDKRLTDIIPTIQANQNEIITAESDGSIVRGCAGCGKTMIMLQRLEYLNFNNKINLYDTIIVAPSENYKSHIQPVVDDLKIGAARRLTMAELYRELILLLGGVKQSERRALKNSAVVGDEELSSAVVSACYSKDTAKKLLAALEPVRASYRERMQNYSAALVGYVEEREWNTSLPKPNPPAVSVKLEKFPFIPPLGAGYTKAKLYLLLLAYVYIVGKPFKLNLSLYIDEGQDYFPTEYKLLYTVLEKKFHIYGDENQQLDPSRGIGNFDKLRKFMGDEKYFLNENYRNAREITEYVNSLLGMSVTSLGLEGGKVERIDMSVLKERFAQHIGSSDDRVAVIYSPNDEETAKELCSFVPSNRLYTVTQAKGTEYERVYACGAMSDAEKYVAYTRALAELYVVD